ncbi:MAG: cytochrome c3 family protein [Halopseudomonas sp.]
MKLSKSKLALAIVGAAAVGVAGFGVAGIKDSKHDLGSAGSGAQGAGSYGTQEICVFCHTPHGSDTSAPVPLWNKELSNKTTAYKTYDQLGTSSLDGAVASVGSVSLACLSCHDGAQAMDNMLNAPGSGMGTPSDQVADRMTGEPVPMLGTDLRNDHPVGIQYCGGGYDQTTSAGTPTSVGCADGDFNQAFPLSLNGVPVWYVETDSFTTSTGAASGRDKYDMQLYTRNPSSSGDIGANYSGNTSNSAEPFVECASCHDPHQDGTSTFLRIQNAGSSVCLACHNK